MSTPFIKKRNELKNKVPCVVEKISNRIGQDPKNFLIEGDNLHTLVSLISTHKGKVDLCIYDPDNTITVKHRGKNLGDGYDNHVWLQEHILKISLQRELLSDTGLLVVFLRPNIVHFAMAGNYKIPGLISLFGSNYLELINKSRTRANVSPSFFSKDHEYVLVFSKKGDPIVLKGIPKDFSRYSNQDNDPRGLWVHCDLTAKVGKKNKNIFPVTNPSTGLTYYPAQGRQWGFSQQSIGKMIQENRIIWPKKKSGRLGYKLFMVESKNQAVSSLDLNFPTAQGTMELKKFGKLFYRDPKSPALFSFLIGQLLYNKPNATVLDLTAGSGTTAQSVLQYNYVNKTHIKFIICSNDKRQVEFIRKRIIQTIEGNDSIEATGGSLACFDLKMVQKQELLEDSKVELLPFIPDLVKFKYTVFNKKQDRDTIVMESSDGTLKVLINNNLEGVTPIKGVIVEEGLLNPGDCPYPTNSVVEALINSTSKALKQTEEIL